MPVSNSPFGCYELIMQITTGAQPVLFYHLDCSVCRFHFKFYFYFANEGKTIQRRTNYKIKWRISFSPTKSVPNVLVRF